MKYLIWTIALAVILIGCSKKNGNNSSTGPGDNLPDYGALISGNWNGTWSGSQNPNRPFNLRITYDGNSVTGTNTSMLWQNHQIKNGTFSETTRVLRFDVDPGNNAVYHFRATYSLTNSKLENGTFDSASYDGTWSASK